MTPDLLALYERASQWTLEKVDGAVDQLDARTPCEEWDVRTLLRHMLETQHYFIGAARGEEASLAPEPTEPLGADPRRDFRDARDELIRTFGQPGTIEKTGPALGIAYSDQLLHGWDLAKATGQDTTMPDGLPEVAYEMIHGRFSDDERQGVFKPEVPVPDDASAQARLLAYTGRTP